VIYIAKRRSHGAGEEWDWPPKRRFRTRFDVYRPTGWNSPGAKRAVRIYWRVTIGVIKMLLAVMLSIVAISAFWLLWIIVTL
jgi:hypothetical protein